MSYELVNEDVCLSLELNGDFVVCGVEYLLSAFEAMGIDNCRIEFEGIGEVFIMDGSVFLYVYDICCVGFILVCVVDGGEVLCMVWKIIENVMV